MVSVVGICRDLGFRFNEGVGFGKIGSDRFKDLGDLLVGLGAK